MCGQRSPWSACAFAQSDQGLRYPLTESMASNCRINRRLEKVMVRVNNYFSQRMTKPTKWHVRPAKRQISLGIRRVWSEPSMSTWRKLGSLATHWAHSKDSDQAGWMPRLIWVFARRTCHFVGFVMRWLISLVMVDLIFYRPVICKAYWVLIFNDKKKKKKKKNRYGSISTRKYSFIYWISHFMALRQGVRSQMHDCKSEPWFRHLFFMYGRRAIFFRSVVAYQKIFLCCPQLRTEMISTARL